MKVSLLMAQTLDGRIAKNANHFPDWTESADKKFFRSRTKEAGVMIMGSKTFETLPGLLPGRWTVVLTREPAITIKGEKYRMYFPVFDGEKMAMTPTWQEDADNKIIVTSCSPKEILKRLEKKGFNNPIVAGGTTINSLFARENLIDEVIVTVSPVIFGQGLGVFDETVEMRLQLEKFEKIGETTLALWYSVHK